MDMHKTQAPMVHGPSCMLHAHPRAARHMDMRIFHSRPPQASVLAYEHARWSTPIINQFRVAHTCDRISICSHNAQAQQRAHGGHPKAAASTCMRPSSWRHAAKWASHTRTRTHSSKSTTEHLPRISRAHTCAQHRPIGTSVRESEGHTVRLHGQYRQVGGAVCLSVASREVSDKSVVSKSAALCVYLWRLVKCPTNLSCRSRRRCVSICGVT